jgi:hypothetical protein
VEPSARHSVKSLEGQAQSPILWPWTPTARPLNLYLPHTCWCWLPVNDSYQQGGTFRAILASESHWLQPWLVLSDHWWPTPAGVGRVLDGQSVKPSKGQAQSPNPNEHPALFLAQNNPSNLMAMILSMIDFLIKKSNGLSTIVWVSIPVRPKLPSRVHHLLKKVIILNCDGLWTLAIVWRVQRPNSWFLAIWLVEIDGLSPFGHTVGY